MRCTVRAVCTSLRAAQKLRALVKDCWAHHADKRPTFEEVVTRLEEVLDLLPLHVHVSLWPVTCNATLLHARYRSAECVRLGGCVGPVC